MAPMSTASGAGQLCFFLGGYDLEMQTIRGLLDVYAPESVYDKQLRWGAKASSYRREIESALTNGKLPVLIELELDFDINPDRVIMVDHHAESAGEQKPTSLEQTVALLNLPKSVWTRRLQLVSANDRGGIAALVEMGATREEIEQIRAADRVAQGITVEEELAGLPAVAARRTTAGGNLTIVELPHHRTAVVTDLLHTAMGGPGFRNLVVLCPDEVMVEGEGALIVALSRKFPLGWYGGNLPTHGFWGGSYAPAEVIDFLKEILTP